MIWYNFVIYIQYQKSMSLQQKQHSNQETNTVKNHKIKHFQDLIGEWEKRLWTNVDNKARKEIKQLKKAINKLRWTFKQKKVSIIYDTKNVIQEENIQNKSKLQQAYIALQTAEKSWTNRDVNIKKAVQEIRSLHWNLKDAREYINTHDFKTIANNKKIVWEKSETTNSVYYTPQEYTQKQKNAYLQDAIAVEKIEISDSPIEEWDYFHSDSTEDNFVRDAILALNNIKEGWEPIIKEREQNSWYSTNTVRKQMISKGQYLEEQRLQTEKERNNIEKEKAIKRRKTNRDILEKSKDLLR